MTIYYSVLSLDELADLPKEERHQYLGIIVSGQIVQPARCYECESEVAILDDDVNKTQCMSCGIINDVHYYDDYSPFRAEEKRVELINGHIHFEKDGS